VVGHSLGGARRLALASGWFGPRVDTVVAVGVKVAWTPDELAKAAALAARPVPSFATRDEAAGRHLRVSGLVGLVEPESPVVDAGLTESHGSWRLALDPAAFGVGAPDMPSLVAASRAARVVPRIVLARGEHDAMVSDEQLRELAPDAVTLRGWATTRTWRIRRPCCASRTELVTRGRGCSRNLSGAGWRQASDSKPRGYGCDGSPQLSSERRWPPRHSSRERSPRSPVSSVTRTNDRTRTCSPAPRSSRKASPPTTARARSG
jgi:hypothetical protein